MSDTVATSQILQLKGGMYTLTALKLMSANLAEVEVVLAEKIQQAPRFFQNTPVVIDCTHVREKLDFVSLRNMLIRHELIPVGVRGVNPIQRADVVAASLAILADTSPEKDLTVPDIRPSTIDASKNTGNKLITHPVRSGQQFYARGGDLIVRGAVSHGAELLADGNIHVYGPLRGRALAGVSGNKEARIFCHCLEAELISIAGEYKLSDDLKNTLWKSQCEIFLSADDNLQIVAL